MSPAEKATSTYLPILRMLVIANLGSSDRGVHPVRRGQLADTMARLAPGLDLHVANHLKPGARSDILCRLRFQEAADFEPDAVARALPATADLLTARSLLAGRPPDASAESLLAALPESVRSSDLGEKLSAGDGPAEGQLDTLLAKVDLPDTPDRDPVEAVLAEIDRRLSRQLSAICNEPAFAALESTWRGLQFLLDRTDAASPIEIEVLSAPKEECLGAFFETAFHDEYEGNSETPLALVVLAYDFDCSAHDLDLIRDAARMGESLQTPFLASMGIGYWGLKRPGLLASMPDPVARSRGPEYAKWNRLRDDERSIWLAFAANRLLARPARAEKAPPMEGFTWDAHAAAGHDAPLWMLGVWPLAAAVSGAYADSGPRLPVSGVRLEDLPCRPYGGGRKEPYAYPLEVSLSETRARDLSRCGFAPLTARRDEDVAAFPAVPTFHRPKRYDLESATLASHLAATLPYQIFASMASAALQRAAAAVAPGASREDVQRIFLEGLATLLAAGGIEDPPAQESANGEGRANGAPEEASEPPPPIVIEINNLAEEPDLREVTVRLRPLFRISGGEADLVLVTAIPS